MRIRNMLGLLVVGGAAYAHKKHGGEFTFESIKQSVDDLLRAVQQKARPIADKLQETLRETEGEQTGYGSSGYGYQR